MIGACFGLLLNLLAFSLIGVGPSLFLLSSKRRILFAAGISPVVGFIVTTVFGTYLTLLDIPVSRWYAPWLLLAVIASILLAIVRIRRGDPASEVVERNVTLAGIGGFGVVLILLTAPQLLGGLQYSVLRGNGTDSFNYITLAEYLDREPFSFAGHTDRQILEDRNQSYERARQLMTERWATPMMLAFSARVARTPIYRFDFLFSILTLLLAYGPAFLYALSLNVRPPLAALTAVAMLAGFWGQLVTDVRALAQENSLPVLLLLALLIARFESETPDSVPWGEHVLRGITILSLALIYPEIIPMTALAGGLFFLIATVRSREPRGRIAAVILSLGVAAIGMVPAMGLFISFLQKQLNLAASASNNWHLAYFPWLYSNPISGMWGLSFFLSVFRAVAPGNGLESLLNLVLTLFGLGLTVLLFVSLVRTFVGRTDYSPWVSLAGCLALAALLQWGYLVHKGQLWAGGKGLSFGYPFLFLSLAAFISSSFPADGSALRTRLNSIAVPGVLIWLLTQCALGASRPILAEVHRDPPDYILGHGDYRRYDWDLSQIEAALDAERGVTVWSDISDPWLSDYVGFVLSGRVQLVNLGTTRDLVDFGVGQHVAQKPQYLLVEKAALGSTKNEPAVASTKDLVLLKYDAGRPIPLGIENPNGMESTPQGGPFFWMGGEKPTIFTVLSPMDGTAEFHAKFDMGPSLPGVPHRTLLIATDQYPSPECEVISAEAQTMYAPVKEGTNVIKAIVEDKPAVVLPTDPRPLLLRVESFTWGIEAGSHPVTTCPAGAVQPK